MITYGKGQCEITGNYQSVVIKYRGRIVLKHEHLEFIEDIGNNNARVRNFKSKSMLIKNNNQIHIGFTEPQSEDKVLFRYVGEFRILSVKVDDKNAKITEQGIDYWNKINSTWDYAGKPEKYRGNYKFGKVGINRRKKK
jgi:hypothetical protein